MPEEVTSSYTRSLQSHENVKRKLYRVNPRTLDIKPTGSVDNEPADIPEGYEN